MSPPSGSLLAWDAVPEEADVTLAYFADAGELRLLLGWRWNFWSYRLVPLDVPAEARLSFPMPPAVSAEEARRIVESLPRAHVAVQAAIPVEGR